MLLVTKRSEVVGLSLLGYHQNKVIYLLNVLFYLPTCLFQLFQWWNNQSHDLIEINIILLLYLPIGARTITSVHREKKHPYDCFTNLSLSEDKSIPLTALWCPSFSNHGWLYQAWKTTAYYCYYFDYLLSWPFKGPCRTLGIYFRQNS